MKFISYMAAGIFLIAASVALHAQDTDRIVFTDPKSSGDKSLGEAGSVPSHIGGVDIMLGMDGFGLGVFYNYMIDDEWTVIANMSFSEAEDSRQRSIYNYWGQEIPVNKLNYVFRIPFFAGIQYRLFSEDIVENFRPFLNAGAGPVMLYIAPSEVDGEEKDFFGSLPYGKPSYTFGGFLGAGAQFGFDRSSVLGVNVRYYIVPTPAGVRAVDQGELSNANGFFITLNLGTAF